MKKIVISMKKFKWHDWIGLVLCIITFIVVFFFCLNNCLESIRDRQKEETLVSYIVKVQGNKVTVEEVQR
jgi:hypothetical protein